MLVVAAGAYVRTGAMLFAYMAAYYSAVVTAGCVSLASQSRCTYSVVDEPAAVDAPDAEVSARFVIEDVDSPEGGQPRENHASGRDAAVE